MSETNELLRSVLDFLATQNRVASAVIQWERIETEYDTVVVPVLELEFFGDLDLSDPDPDLGACGHNCREEHCSCGPGDFCGNH